MEKKSISNKIVILLIRTSFSIFTLMLLIAGVGAYVILRASEKCGNDIGDKAANNSREALENMATDALEGTLKEKASSIDACFDEVNSELNEMAEEAEIIYENPDSYPDRMVPLPQKTSELSIQLLWSSKVDFSGIEKDEPNEIQKLGNLQDMLLQNNKYNDMIASTYIATKTGYLIQADYIAYSKFDENGEQKNYEAAEREWYISALTLKEGEHVYSNIMPDIATGKDCIVCSEPIYDKNKKEVVGVAGVGAYLDTIQEIVLNTFIGENGFSFLVDADGKVIFSGSESVSSNDAIELYSAGSTVSANDFSENALSSSDRTTASTKVEEKTFKEVLSSMMNGETDVCKSSLSVADQDEEVYIAYTPLDVLGWSIAAVRDATDITGPAKASSDTIYEMAAAIVKSQEHSMLLTLVIMIFFILSFVFLITYSGVRFSNQIISPLKLLTRKVSGLEGDNLTEGIVIETGDEVEELGNAFNKMTHNLQNYIVCLANVTAEKEKIRTELSVAARIQSDMLPSSEIDLKDREEFDLSAKMVPAREVGGDFYDFFLADSNHLVIVMADVSGKGVPASLFMVVSRTLLRGRIAAGIESLADVVKDINNKLCENDKSGMFVTAWIGVINLTNGILNFVNAGHNPPLLKSNKKEFKYEKEFSGFVLAGMEDSEYEEYTLLLKKGDMLFLYTDGVTEAHDVQNVLYGEERLIHKLNEKKSRTPNETIEQIWKDILCFRKEAEQFDDITMMSLFYYGTDAAVIEDKPSMENMPVFMNFLEEYMKANNIEQNILNKILLVSDDVISNVFYYSKASTLKVKIGITQNTIYLIFEDDGISFNPLKQKEPDITSTTKDRSIGGLGIYLVKKQMDKVEYTYIERKNQLTIYKNLCTKDIL